jgi:DNA-binding transcriptional LysR family regulator
MQLRQLEYFVAVAERSNFTRAAEATHVAQSGLSQQIRDLERELGAVLFERTSRAVRLTPAGQVLLPLARRVLADVREARYEVGAVAGLERGRLALGATPGLSATRVPALLAEFHRRRPGIEITVGEDGPQGPLASLLSGDVDLAFATLPADGAPPGVATLPVEDEELALVVACGHPLAGRASVPIAALASEAFLDLAACPEIEQLVAAACREAGFARHVALRVRHLDILFRLITLNLGVAILPEPAANAESESESREGLAVVRLEPPTLARRLVLAWRTDLQAKPAARAFLSLARHVLRDSTSPSALVACATS